MDYLIYVAIGLLALTILSIVVDLVTMRNNQIIYYDIISVKNKVKKSRRYCYPKVVDDNGREFYVYTAKKNGYDRFHIGEKLAFYAPGLFNRAPRCKVGFYHRTMSVAIALVMVFVFYLTQK